jgi:UDP-N-acetylmuramoylalanine--D-glutamate ligase
VSRADRAALEGARVVVAGLGTSGLAAARALHAVGARVLAVDSSEQAVEQAELPAAVERFAAADPDAFADAALEGAFGRPDVLVASPGLRPALPVLRRAGKAGVPCWSEVELAWRIQEAEPDRLPWLTLTGTNGKTTTVGMLSSILATAGLRAPAVGNVGEPVSAVTLDGAADVLAVELSSFQLHLTHTVAPRAAACLNIAPDHIDWHGSYEAYWAAKAKVFDRTERACVYSLADPATREMVEQADVQEGARAIGVTAGVPQVAELGVVDGVLCDRAFLPQRQTHALPLAELADLAHLAAGGAGELPGHVVVDALTAAALARAQGVEPPAVAAGLRAYRPGAHRIELVVRHDGVAYVDDSKATNAHAASASLASVPPGHAVWVAGGLAKGARFEDLVRERADRLRAVVLIGVDRAPLLEALARHAPEVPVVEVRPDETEDVMTRAVREAARLARPGDTVLLAPACASMDQFRSYADRGEAFARAARALAG